MLLRIFKKNIDQIIDISREFDVERIFLFGSCLENPKKANDIDIAVKGIDPKIFFKYYGKISKKIDEQIDIIDLDDVRDHIYNRIISYGKIIYEK